MTDNEAEVVSAAKPRSAVGGSLRAFGPGIVLSAAVAIVATLLAPWAALALPIPAMVIALIIGIALSRYADAPVFRPGLSFCVKKLLRWAVALLGVRVALGDIVALGFGAVIVVVASMGFTLVAGFAIARAFGQPRGYGALAGAATAVCGASAALATSTVVPSYPGKEADIAFVVVGVNTLATLGMVLYPPLCVLLGFDPHMTGAMLGITLHDVAQVVGAGYAISDEVGNTAVIVKLFRVFLLLPVVLCVGWYFTRVGAEQSEARVPVPVFALVFLALCCLNSAVPVVPALIPIYAPVKEMLNGASTWGLLVAIGALGLGTSPSAIAALGWRHVATLIATALVILVVGVAGLLLLQ